MEYKWVDEKSAKNQDCPFGQSYGVGEITCSVTGCMAWVQHPKDEALGRCGMIPGWLSLPLFFDYKKGFLSQEEAAETCFSDNGNEIEAQFMTEALEEMIEAFCVDNFKMTSQQWKAFEAAQRALTWEGKPVLDHGHGLGEYVDKASAKPTLPSEGMLQ